MARQPYPSVRNVIYRIVKRALDVTVATVLLVVALPVMLIVAGLIRWRLGAPVLFRQGRAGLHGMPFELLKFRTMRDIVDGRGQPLPDADRLTPLGRTLRTLSLDELPQLWNVLRGDMSLVGPRPLLARYLHRYNPVQMRRHDVPPGITGWAQINGRNAVSWDERFQLDLWYVEHASLWLDLQIFVRTVVAMFIPRGVSSADHATMPEFEGSGPAASSCDRIDRNDASQQDTVKYSHA